MLELSCDSSYLKKTWTGRPTGWTEIHILVSASANILGPRRPVTRVAWPNTPPTPKNPPAGATGPGVSLLAAWPRQGGLAATGCCLASRVRLGVIARVRTRVRTRPRDSESRVPTVSVTLPGPLQLPESGRTFRVGQSRTVGLQSQSMLESVGLD